MSNVIRRGNTPVEPKERVATVTKISPEALREGDFEFDLGADATPDDEKEFQEMVEGALKMNRPLYIEPTVKVIDRRGPAKQEPVAAPAPKVEDDSDDDAAPEVTPEPAKKETPVAPVAPVPQQQPIYMPTQGYAQGQQPWQYDPFTGMPLARGPAPQPQNVPQQPHYNPQPIVPIGQQYVGPQGQQQGYNPLPYGFQQPQPAPQPQDKQGNQNQGQSQ